MRPRKVACTRRECRARALVVAGVDELALASRVKLESSGGKWHWAEDACARGEKKERSKSQTRPDTTRAVNGQRGGGRERTKGKSAPLSTDEERSCRRGGRGDERETDRDERQYYWPLGNIASLDLLLLSQPQRWPDSLTARDFKGEFECTREVGARGRQHAAACDCRGASPTLAVRPLVRFLCECVLVSAWQQQILSCFALQLIGPIARAPGKASRGWCTLTLFDSVAVCADHHLARLTSSISRQSFKLTRISLVASSARCCCTAR